MLFLVKYGNEVVFSESYCLKLKDKTLEIATEAAKQLAKALIKQANKEKRENGTVFRPIIFK